MGLPHSLIGLRPIRRVRKISVAAAAEAIGVQSTSYLRFENGTRRIYFDKVLILADMLGVRSSDLASLMDETDAAQLCDRRDKEAMAGGTFRLALRIPGAPAGAVPPPPLQVPPPPPPPPSGDADIGGAARILSAWGDD